MKKPTMKLDTTALGISLGALWTIVLFVATIWVWIGIEYFNTKGGGTLILFSRFYLGYSVTLLGAIISIPYALVSGLIAGGIIAWVYNKIAK